MGSAIPLESVARGTLLRASGAAVALWVTALARRLGHCRPSDVFGLGKCGAWSTIRLVD